MHTVLETCSFTCESFPSSLVCNLGANNVMDKTRMVNKPGGDREKEKGEEIFVSL